ncbi:hypothetical protein [Nocardioides aurantiacus]|uniref:Uncharacterized protein n=1 Tax=Nocardioides aurantiacus TaxID=86796 RepID=A0A3N2CW58_9ACTN|nr:hypothetical protein [Nocardioides aurantiacus]ROR91777.1 hypothetical protein EDD33_2652 [Nocardioides aurantiacus]
MAIPSGWSATDWAAYKQQTLLPSRIANRVKILDLNHKLLVDVPPIAFTEGQWNLVPEADGGVDRTFQGTFFDFADTLGAHLDPEIAPRRLIRVEQGMWIESLSKWLWVPTFTGRPHVSNDNGGGLWGIEAQGKDCFHNRGVPAQTFRKGSRIVDAIRNYLVSTGETKMLIPSSTVFTKRLTSDIKFGGASDQMTPLAALRKAASLLGCQLYWDGAGTAILRPWPTASSPVFSWDGEKGAVLSEPTFATDMSTLKNRWTGGGRNTLRADVPAIGAYSPTSLQRGGVAWSDIDFGEDNDSLSSTALAQFGRTRVNQLVTLSTNVSCDLLPFFAVDPMDYAEIRIPGRTEKCTIRTASFPIVGAWTAGSDGPTMSLGSHHNTRRGSYGSVRVTGTSRKPTKRRKR